MYARDTLSKLRVVNVARFISGQTRTVLGLSIVIYERLLQLCYSLRTINERTHSMTLDSGSCFSAHCAYIICLRNVLSMTTVPVETLNQEWQTNNFFIFAVEFKPRPLR
jgi:hypothetical protein